MQIQLHYNYGPVGNLATIESRSRCRSVAGTRAGPYHIVAQVGAGGMSGSTRRGYAAGDHRSKWNSTSIPVLFTPPTPPTPRWSRQSSFRTIRPTMMPADVRTESESYIPEHTNLEHPHICALYDVGRQDGIDFLVMPLLDGETLEKRLAKRSVTARAGAALQAFRWQTRWIKPTVRESFTVT